MLTSIELCKSLLDIDSDKHDTLLYTLASAVSEWLPGVCDREFAYQSARVEQHHGGTDFIRTQLFPILSVTEMKEAPDRAFDEADPLDEDAEFVVEGGRGPERNRGIVRKLYGRFTPGRGTVRITFDGGYYCGDPADKPADVDLLPPTVKLAAAQMVAHLFRNRERFGNRTVTIGDMQIDEVQDGLLKIVDSMLERYKAVV